uniref:Uncharacterized protein n=1 Tax=uncultured nuHF1 cluster bacterium HF0770_35I22 TaxID=723586 RepID=E7C7N4_9BACT|nr:hypothetical protein [uncultured nuHF1 cluster bacterium HF0770_35I22]
MSDFEADKMITPVALKEIAIAANKLILSSRSIRLKIATWITSVFEYMVPTAKLRKEKR